MNRRTGIQRVLAVGLLAGGLLAGSGAHAQGLSSDANELPAWFAQTFLDLREDVRDAAKQGKRVMIYFHQNGCPYCAKLLSTNFTQKSIVDKARKHLAGIDVNIWGDREVTWLDGKAMTEKQFAAMLKVQFTPTLIFLDERGEVVVRLNGYYPPHRFEAVVDYVAGKKEREIPFSEYMKTAVKESASPELHAASFFMKAPLDLTRTPGGKPLAVVFETPYCSGCDEMHKDGFTRQEVLEQIARFDVARVVLGSKSELVTPDGRKRAADAWARELDVAYTPSIVFFDDRGKEAFRIEAYLRPFHLAGSFDYVSSGGYRTEPSFQRFLQAKAERIQRSGGRVELWR
ncbi:MAG: thioredoxin fold domain-containing protein [Burkholderiales bacterium]|nr:thioredoxin fold domain-containing protein [Burkholderiales bacterium]